MKYQLENKLSYLINSKRARRKSHRDIKKIRLRRERRKINQDINYEPKYKQYEGWEW